MAKEKKKLLILAILELLREKTDKEHPMRYIPIIEALLKDFGLSATRKSVQRNINDLQAAGYPLYFLHGWYYDHPWEDREADALVDSMALNAAIPAQRRKELADKLKEQLGRWYVPAVERAAQDGEFSAALDTALEAVAERRQISFRYADYDADGQLHARKGANGRRIQYKVSPYQVSRLGDFCYLMCNLDGQQGLSFFRLDRMQDVRILRSSIKPFFRATEDEARTGLEDCVTCLPVRGGGRVRTYVLRIDRSLVGDAVDWFGKGITFSRVTEGDVQISVKTDTSQIRAWLSAFEGQTQLLRGRLDAPEAPEAE